MILVHAWSCAAISKFKHKFLKILPILGKYLFFLCAANLYLPFLFQVNGIRCYVVYYVGSDK